MFELNRASLTNEYGDELVLTGWSLQGDLRGMCFEATLAQTFINSTGEHAELIYNFPLPWGAELLSLEAQVGEKHFTGSVIGKRESEAKYEEALSHGDSAILLERNAGDDYTLNLGGIKQNEKVVISVRYGQLVRFTKSGLRISIPTVIAPRFGDPMKDGGLKQYQVSESDFLAEYPFVLDIAVHGDWVNSGIESPSHSIKVGPVADGIRKISLAKESYLDRDFILSFDQPMFNAVSAAAVDYVDPSKTMVFAAFRPDLADQKSKNVNVKILVDCSGSMEGDSIEAARQSLHAFVNDLSSNDHFSLSKFGNMAMHRSKGLWTATEPAKLAAQRWIETIEADMGGTEMAGALMETFELASQEPADVLLVTDGDIHAVDHVIKLAKESKHRLFIVGIGCSPSENHLRRMAEETLGACDFVAPGEDVGPAVTNMFARLRTSAVRDLKVSWPDSVVPAWVSPMEKVAYDGDTIYAFALVAGTHSGNISLSGRADDGSEVELGSMQWPTYIHDRPDYSRMAMSGYINQLIAQEGDHAGKGQQLAEDYQLVTDRTNFFMHVDRAEDKAKDMPEVHKVSQMVPAGYGGFGSVKRATVMYCHSSSSSPFGDFSQYDLPPGLRSARSSITTVCRSSKLSFDIPAFLRKDSDKQSQPEDAWELDVCDARLFADTIEYEGFTPLGMLEWVSHTEFRNWPTTYAGLIQIGVPSIVVDWLELLVATDSESDEATIVASFLYAFTSPSVEAVLGPIVDRFRADSDQNPHLLVTHDVNVIPLDAYVESDVLRAMDQSIAGSWPICMFDMELA